MSSTATAAAGDVLPALPPIRIAVSQAFLAPASYPACSSAASPSTAPTPDAEYVALPGVREQCPPPPSSRCPPPPRPRHRSPLGAFQDPPPAEELLTEYERERAQRIMSNNKMLQSLGIPALASILNSSNAKSKGVEHGVVDKLTEQKAIEFRSLLWEII
ncbi:unnamed protein product [Urochloa humidicola]